MFQIAGRAIGPTHPCCIVAELSGNAGQDIAKAERLIEMAKEAGADAVKLQTYDPDQMFDKDDIISGLEPPWEGMTGRAIYRLVALPWEWQVKLKRYADEIGIILFSTVCDEDSVDFWESQRKGLRLPAYKIAEWQAKDWRFIDYVNKVTRKPMIVSVKNTSQPLGAWQHASEVAFLAKDDLVLMSILRRQYKVPIGYSNHGPVSKCVEAVAKGACIVEQHVTLSPDTIDGKFAALPDQFKQMVKEIRMAQE